MSLRVWLPLTKDLRNQGLDDVTVTNNGATFNANGKLGGCYYFNNVYAWLPMDYSTFGTEFSVVFWYKINTAFSGNRHLVCLCNQCGWTQLKFTCVATSNSTLAFNIGDGSTSARTLSTSQIIGSWQHICFTFNNKIAKVYVNGVQTGTATYPINPDWSGTTKMGIGGAPDGHECATTLSLNDIRIYDHTLSPFEIKQISQGLVLHYPLSDKYLEDTTNLVTGISAGGQTTVNNNIVTTSGANKDTYFIINLSEDIVVGTQYTFSCDAEIPSGTWRFPLGNQDNTTLDFVLHNGHNVYTFVANDTSWGTKRLFMDDMGGATNSARSTGLKTKIYNFQLEKKDHETGFAGYGASRTNSIVYDTSGYSNNGTPIGSFGVDKNTPRYAVSTKFNGTDNTIQTPNLTTIITDKNYTISCWTNKATIGDKNYQTIYGGPSGFELEARSGSSSSPLFRIHNWGGGTTPYEFNKWYHFCFVHTDSDSKLYINGELKITGSSANVPSGNYFVGAWKTATQQNFEGNMSDFRIYATALSAEDVKSLYQNSAYIDNQGNIYGAVYEEV